MASDWPVIKLSELTSKITKGTTPSKKDGGFVSSGVNFIKAECVTLEGTVDESKFAYVTPEVHHKYERSHLEADDILFSMAGVILGKTAVVKEDHLPANTNQALALIRPVKEKVLPRYLHYFLQQRSVFYFVNNSTSQSAQPNINLQEIGNLDITLPSLPEQKAIAHILGSLDDKIELNRRMNETLEGMAQALFKSWFVDFDPVIDNILLRNMGIDPYSTTEPSPNLSQRERDSGSSPSGRSGDEGSIYDGIPEEFVARAETRRKALADFPTIGKNVSNVRKLFPDSFQTSELGPIPAGWDIGHMSDHAAIEMGQSPKGDTYNENGIGTPLVNGPVEFGPYFTNKSKWTTSPTKLSESGDLIVCVRGSTTGRFVKSDGQYCLGRGVCSVRGKQSQSFVDQIFKSSISEMLGLTTGSTFPNWSRQTLEGFEVIVPPESIVDKFDALITPKVERIESGVVESESLGTLRDTLLPKLISGELRVKSVNGEG